MKITLVYEYSTCQALFCVNCMRSYILSKIQDGLISSHYLVCSTPDCVHMLFENLIEAFTGSTKFQKYNIFLNNLCATAHIWELHAAAPIEPLHSKHRRIMSSCCHRESCMRRGGGFHKLPVCQCLKGQPCKSKKQQHNNTRSCPSCLVEIEKNGWLYVMKCTPVLLALRAAVGYLYQELM